MCRIERPSKDTPFARVVFQYKLQPGACPKSYGLHVAALAGIPQSICQVAERVGTALESRLSRNFRHAHRALAAPEGDARDDGAASDGSDVDVSDVALLSPLLGRVLACACGGAAGRGRAGVILEVWQEAKRLLPALGAL